MSHYPFLKKGKTYSKRRPTFADNIFDNYAKERQQEKEEEKRHPVPPSKAKYHHSDVNIPHLALILPDCSALNNPANSRPGTGTNKPKGRPLKNRPFGDLPFTVRKLETVAENEPIEFSPPRLHVKRIKTNEDQIDENQFIENENTLSRTRPIFEELKEIPAQSPVKHILKPSAPKKSSRNHVTSSLQASPPPFTLLDQFTNTIGQVSPKLSRTNEPVPLKNFGNTCFLNAVIQGFISMAKFVKIIQREYSTRLLKSLSTLFTIYEKSRTSTTRLCQLNNALQALKDEVGRQKSEFLSNEQQDAVEFAETILRIIIDESENDTKCNFVDFWTSIMRKDATCPNCFSITALPDDKSICLYLNFKLDSDAASESLQDMVKAYFSHPEVVTFPCECGSPSQNVVYLPKVWPKMLLIVLKRYDKSGRKNLTPIEFDQLLKVPERSSISDTCSPSRSKELHYFLKSVICHEGDIVKSGHYTNFVKNEDNIWFKTNDEIITETTFAQVLNDAAENSYLFMFEVV